MIERFNRTLLDKIAVYTDQNQRDWDEHLPMLTVAYTSFMRRPVIRQTY